MSFDSRSFDSRYLQAARDLAATLRRYGHDRHEDDKKKIALLHSELANLHILEEQEQQKDSAK